MINNDTSGIFGGSETDRKNFVLNAAEGSIYLASTAFINPQTVLPALIIGLGGSNIVVGALSAIVYVGSFLPQIFAARYVEAQPWKKKWALTFGAVHRVILLSACGVVFLFGRDDPQRALSLFLLLYGLMQIVIGVSTPGWFDMVAKLTPPLRRGRLMGLRTSVGGAAAFLCGIVLTWLLATSRFPGGYVLAIFLAFLLQVLSLYLQSRLVESEPSPTNHRQPVVSFLGNIPRIIRENPPFRKFLSGSILLTLAAMPLGFFTVNAIRRFGADGAAIGEFTLLMVAVQVVSAFVNGYLADRFGNKTVLLIVGGALMLASITALLAPTLAWYRLVYIFLGINIGSEVSSRYNIAVEYGPALQRSTYIGLMNTILAPFYAAGIIGGVIGELLGLDAVIASGMFFSVAGLWYLIVRVRDPRMNSFSRAGA